MEFSTRKKEVALTIFSNLLLQVVTAICGFILPPLIIEVFGSSVNGMVSSITQFIAYLNLVEAGVGGASIAALYKPLAENNTDERNGILSATSSFYNKSGFIFSALIFVLAFLYPVLVGNEVNKIQSGLMVLVLGITGAAEFFLIGKYRVLLTADKKTYVISFIQMIAVILNTAVAVILIKLDFDILVVKLSSSLIYLSRYFAIFYYIKRKYLDLNLKTEPNKKAISQSKNVLVHQICGLVVLNSPLIIITIFCSLKDASVYAIYAMVFAAVGNLISSFANGLQAFLGESLVKEDVEKTKKIFGKFETIFYCIEGWIYSLVYILIIPFMNIYTKKFDDTNYIQPILALAMCLVGILNYMRNPSLLLIDAAGHYKETQNRAIIESLLNLFFSIFFVLKFGFIGISFGSICSYLYRSFDIMVYSNKNILKQTALKSFAKFFTIGILYVAGTYILSCFQVNNDDSSYFTWCIYAIKCGVILGIFPFIFVILAKIKYEN